MPSRLPVVAGDSGGWGGILNDFLSQSLGSDGTLKGIPAFNVKDPAYGAKGDGVTDDTIAIQNALTAVPSGGGQVFFPVGNYRVTAALLPVSGTKIIGTGWASILSTTTILANDIFRLSNSLANIEITGIHFQSNYSGTSASDTAIRSNPAASDVWIHHNWFETLSTGVFFADGGSDWKITDNNFFNVLAPVQHGTGGVTTAIDVSRNVFTGTATMPLDDSIAISGAATDVSISFNHIDKVGSATSTVSKAHGILIQPSSASATHSRFRVIGNTILNTDTTHVNVRYAIEIDSTAAGVTVQDIVIVGNTIAVARRGIFISNKGTNILIANNIIRSTSSQGIIIQGTGTSLNDITIQHNYLTTIGERGIHADNTGRLRIFGNSIDGFGANGGIRFDTNTLCEIISNRVVNGTSDGMFFQAATDLIVAFNRVTNNGAFGINFSGTGNTNLELFGNILLSNTSGTMTNVPASVERRSNRLSTGATSGRATLVGGTVTVTTAEVQAADNISLTQVVAGGTLGHLSVGTISTGTNFVINSGSTADTSTVFWQIEH